jgi:hypothetical protein
MTRDRLLPPDGLTPALLAADSCLLLATVLALYTQGRRTTPVDVQIDRLVHSQVRGQQPLLGHLVSWSAGLRVLAVCAVLGVSMLLLAQRRAALLCLVGPAWPCSSRGWDRSCCSARRPPSSAATTPIPAAT